MEKSMCQEFRNKYKVIDETKEQKEKIKNISKEFKDNYADNSKLIISKLKYGR